jgi:hypothetical protein
MAKKPIICGRSLFLPTKTQRPDLLAGDPVLVAPVSNDVSLRSGKSTGISPESGTLGCRGDPISAVFPELRAKFPKIKNSDQIIRISDRLRANSDLT